MSHINDLLRRFSLVVIAGLLATGNACTQTAPIRLTAVLRRDGRVQVLELDSIYGFAAPPPNSLPLLFQSTSPNR